MSEFDDLAARLRPNQHSVIKKYSDRIAALERLRPWLVGVGVAGAFSAALGKAFQGATGTILAIVGAVVAAIGGLFVAAIDYRKLELGTNLTEAEAIAEQAIAHGRASEAERDRVVAEARLLDARCLALIDAGSAMFEACENALNAEDLSLEEAIDTMLRAGQRDILGAIEFDAHEYWAVSVFRVDKAELRRVVALRPNSVEERVEGRSWQRGEGFAGMAWHHDDDVIIPDCNQPEVVAAYKVPPEKRLDTDNARYRSMAVVPIRVGPGDSFWGAVAVSSDHVGRFRRDPSNQRVQNVDTVRLVARVIELLVAGFGRCND